ncbi:glycosyltransferase [Pontibacter vulgaris]|uniref:glycosyltransferase n=1 Tax=Pontibacter vulgaris TaxID=2905679 RepID=UPI001FA79B4B|nr:glycosyltransferase [Pontibacter vulgaris]
MSEKRILLASLLKPINDTRMYEKLGVSLSKMPQVSIHIAGFQAMVPEGAPANISFYPVFGFRRISFGRVQAQTIFWRLLLQIKPQVIIVTTHELLVVSAMYKKQYGCKLIYDIQENYTLNLRAQHNYKSGLKHLLAHGVGSIEKLTASAIDHFFVAEQSYLQELSFLKNKYKLLENKYKPAPNYKVPQTPVRILPGQSLKLLYSGTISDIYGIFEAVYFTQKLHAINNKVSLTIIGYCAQQHTLSQVRHLLQDKPYINLIGGEHLVPHHQIMEEIILHHIGLLPYQPNESTFRCIPTKLYEYMAHALPMVVQQNPVWQQILEVHCAGISIDYRQADPAAVLNAFYSRTYYPDGIPENINWNKEEEKLLKLMKVLLAEV